MPRLLLVDDNQSIHKIAETLLASTDIQLTCASSGAEALALAASAGPFDAALLDTTMLGMDGWQLLERFRHDASTALMPIAMMAGVLDVVDPETVRKAPIQGFLKKPVELRDLADRVRALAAARVEPPTPEPEPEPAPEPETPANFATMPYFKLSDHPLPGSDLLLLEPGDVLAEEPPPAAEEAASAPTPHVDSLELEELDLEGLKGLGGTHEDGEEPPLEALGTIDEVPDLPDFAPEDTLQTTALHLGVVTDELPDLGPELDLKDPEATTALVVPPQVLEPAPALPEDWADESETLLELSADTAWTLPPAAEPALAEHADFGPDSFLDVDAGPEPTPSFLPEIPEQVTPVRFTELTPDDEIPTAAGVEPIQPRDSVPPWATTLSLSEEARAAAATTPADAPLDWDAEPAPAVEPHPPVIEEYFPPVAEHHPEPEAPPPAVEDFLPGTVAAALPAVAQALPAAVEPVHAPVPEEEPAPVPAPASQGTPADPLAVLLADPVLMDRLAKALVARLGEQALREIAWEVMPEMADRLRRN